MLTKNLTQGGKRNTMTEKKLLSLIVLLLLYVKVSIAQTGEPCPPLVIPSEFKNNEFDHNGVTIPYRLLTPEPGTTGQKFPLIVALHGLENFAAMPGMFLRCAGYYALGWLEPSLQDKYPSYVVAPHLHDGLFDRGYSRWGEEKPLDFLKQLIDHLLSTERIDPNRIYLTGHSMGGIATFIIPKSLPGYFAALVPMNTAGGCPEVCLEVDRGVYDNLSIWAVHHRFDAANSNVRAVFNKLEESGEDVYSTHSFGDEIINLPRERMEELIDEHQQFFHTEYRYPCTTWRCHTSSKDTILRDPLFRKWLFRQYKTDPTAVAITSIDERDRFTVKWTAKNDADSVEIWFRANDESKWQKLRKVLAGTRAFDLVPALNREDILINSDVKLVVFNSDNFAYGQSRAKANKAITGLPGEREGLGIQVYPNPAKNKIHLKIKNDKPGEIWRFKMISANGSVVKSGKIEENQVQVAGLLGGIYLLVVQSNTRRLQQRIQVLD